MTLDRFLALFDLNDAVYLADGRMGYLVGYHPVSGTVMLKLDREILTAPVTDLDILTDDEHLPGDLSWIAGSHLFGPSLTAARHPF